MKQNTNGLICQYFPKAYDSGATRQQRVARIAATLNNRPRKCLDYQTPGRSPGSVDALQMTIRRSVQHIGMSRKG